VEQSFSIELGNGVHARAVRLRTLHELNDAGELLGLGPAPVLVVVGGASKMDPEDIERVRGLFTDVLAPLAERLGATVVDGGTDAGVMHLTGTARSAGSHSFPLVGVVVDVLADYGGEVAADAHALEPHHTHFVLVPGSEWGQEAGWLARVASAIAAGRRSATVLANGGEISWSDVRLSLDAGRPVVALGGSGRTADALAAAVEDNGPSDARARELAASGRVLAVDVEDRDEVARLLDELLAGGAAR
jgi:hypothetical protein